MKEPSPAWSQWLFVVWLGLGVIWIPLLPMMGMAFEAGTSWRAYLLVWSFGLYPVSVLIALLMRRRMRVFVFLPVLNLLGIYLSN